jgi:alpha-methylacyl-CoA racemase
VSSDHESTTATSGPLRGIRVIELGGIGPGPYAGMLLADLGADIIRIERPGGDPMTALPHRVLHRGRRSVAVNLRQEGAAEVVLRLVESADVLTEGFRPGVTERLGVGPQACLARNPRLVYGRMTGWGQDGPLALTAGHDINYIALSGALQPIGPADRPPVPPLNLLGDFGAGGMLLALGVAAALVEARASGQGQVVDAAIVDGAASLMGMYCGMKANGIWSDRRSGNMLDGGAPYYDTYTCADGKYISVGALEEPFYQALIQGLGLADDAALPNRWDPANWPALRERFAAVFAGRTRDEWAAVFAATDACVAPVLAPEEAAAHPHLTARATYVEADGVLQPAPAPRFSRTPGRIGAPQPKPGEHTDEVLTEAGFTQEEIAELHSAGLVA